MYRRRVFASAQPIQALANVRSTADVEIKKPSRLTPVEEPQFAARATPRGVGVRLDGSVGSHTNGTDYPRLKNFCQAKKNRAGEGAL